VAVKTPFLFVPKQAEKRDMEQVASKINSAVARVFKAVLWRNLKKNAVQPHPSTDENFYFCFYCFPLTGAA